MSEAENNELTAGKQFKEPRSNQKLKLLYLAKILLNNTDAACIRCHGCEKKSV